MAEEGKSKASRVASEVAPAEEYSENFNDQNQSQDQGPGPYQSQTQGAGQVRGKCMCNPCKCCCRGNLRQACVVIAEVELIFGILALVSFIYGLVSPSSDTTTSTSTSGVVTAKKPAEPNVGPIISQVIFIIFLLGAGIALLLGAMKRSKVACLVHSALAILLSVYQFAGVIFCIIILAIVGEYTAEKCKTVGSDDLWGALLCGLPDSFKTILVFLIVVLLIFLLIFAVLFAYFASNSIALYCHFKNGVLYEGTPLNGCCGGGRGQNQVQPQYQNQNYQYGQPEGQTQSQYQYQYQQQPQSEEPPPEYTSKTEVQSKPKGKSKSKGKSRASSNMSSSKKANKSKSKSKPEL